MITYQVENLQYIKIWRTIKESLDSTCCWAKTSGQNVKFPAHIRKIRPSCGKGKDSETLPGLEGSVRRSSTCLCNNWSTHPSCFKNTKCFLGSMKHHLWEIIKWQMCKILFWYNIANYRQLILIKLNLYIFSLHVDFKRSISWAEPRQELQQFDWHRWWGFGMVPGENEAPQVWQERESRSLNVMTCQRTPRNRWCNHQNLLLESKSHIITYYTW